MLFRRESATGVAALVRVLVPARLMCCRLVVGCPMVVHASYQSIVDHCGDVCGVCAPQTVTLTFVVAGVPHVGLAGPLRCLAHIIIDA